MTAQDKAKELLFKYRQHADWNNEYGSAEQQANIKNANDEEKKGK